MFNYHYKQYIFKQSNGELLNFFCDQKQNLCYNTLTRRGLWSNPVILHKNAYQYFHADMDLEDVFHLLFQDSEGNIRYSRMDGQSIKTVTVLGSKTPNPYNKQLFLAPFKNSVYFFYVVQHENSFMMAYQVLSSSKISSPKVIDYVSGSSLPCSIVYDRDENIYAFYQSYDGKYLQLGYKKYTTLQKHWSEFMPITKYTGTCEYPHAFIDDNGIIHLCYQRRAPKAFEIVYQQKSPDKNLWSPEIIIHSSIHSFENASILQENKNIHIYWVRDDIIYYSTGTLQGTNWSKPVRHNFYAGHQLQCLGFKTNSPADTKPDESSERTQESEQGAALRESSQDAVLRVDSPARPGDFRSADGFRKGDFRNSDSYLNSFPINQYRTENRPLYGFVHPPLILPGNLSNGPKLAFVSTGFSGESSASQFISEDNNFGSFSGSELKKLVSDTLKLIQGNIEELKTGLSAVRSEAARLNYAYEEMSKQLDKYEIRLGLFENRLAQSRRTVKADTTASENRDFKANSKTDDLKAYGNTGDIGDIGDSTAYRTADGKNTYIFTDDKKAYGNMSDDKDGSSAITLELSETKDLKSNTGAKKSTGTGAKSGDTTETSANTKLSADTMSQDSDAVRRDSDTAGRTEKKPSKKAVPSLDQDKLKEWEDWEEPEEWKGM